MVLHTVGGSISVNAHGWQTNAPPIASTIVAMQVVTAKGEVFDISPTEQPELFSAIIGGYGLFGVIAKVELATKPNPSVQFKARFIPQVLYHLITSNR